VLQALKIPALTSPEMTGEWEYKLKQIEQGRFSRPEFMHEIETFADAMVSRAKKFEESEAGAKPTGVVDPKSGQEMVETLREYRTPNGSLALRKVIGGRALAKDELRTLLEQRMVGPLDGFRSRFGKSFSAVVKLTDDGKAELAWDTQQLQSPEETAEILGGESLGKCPVDGGRVFETPVAYVCENSLGENPTCTFKIGKRILGKDIVREQVVKLLAAGKTDLIEGFISNKTRRPFSAFLVLGAGGKVSFDFPPRAPRTGKGKGGKKKTG
jgi:DNA topoisomerase-3